MSVALLLLVLAPCRVIHVMAPPDLCCKPTIGCGVTDEQAAFLRWWQRRKWR